MKIIQLNIERNNHLHRVLPFLQKENADVIMLQEVLQEDAENIAHTLGYSYAFAPMTLYPIEQKERVQGVAIFTKQEPQRVSKEYYFGDENIQRYLPIKRETVSQPFLAVTLKDEQGNEWNIGTLHFGKSWRGKPDAYQRSILPRLMKLLSSYESILFGGDFNIPRGTELYYEIKKRYKDHIPQSHTNSLDAKLHRIPDISFMVDYIWSTDDYTCKSIRQQCHVSDHCAFIADISKKV